MQYTEINAQRVMNGTKTMTRRLVKPGEYLIDYGVFKEVQIMRRGQIPGRQGRTKWREGNVYAVQPGRGKKAIGYARLLEVHEERLQDISTEDIQAEGIPISLCIAIDEEGYKDFNEEEYRDLYAELWDSINTRPGTRWADSPRIWVLTIEVIKDKPEDEQEEDYDQQNFDDHYAAFWNFGPVIDSDGGEE